MRKFTVGRNNEVARTQFPLWPASAETVHRSQGSTVSDFGIDFTGRSQTSIHYMTMSRVQEFENLHLLNYEPKKMKASEEVHLEMNRLCQQPYPSIVKNLYNVSAQLKIEYINSQSLNGHKIDVEHDFNLLNAHVIFCSETRFQESDIKLLTEMSCMYSFRNDAVKMGIQRLPYGIAVYYKPHLIQQLPSITNINGVEILVCPVKRRSDNSIKVISVCKPPVVPLQCYLNSPYSAVRSHYEVDGQLFIMGDFNDDIYGSTSDFEQLKQFMSGMGLQQHIKEMTTDMWTAIDHIYIVMWKVYCVVSLKHITHFTTLYGVQYCDCQGWYSMSPIGSEECITEGIIVNCIIYCNVFNCWPTSAPGWTYWFSAVPMKIAAGSEWEERGIRGLYYGRSRRANVASSLAGLR